MILTDRTRRIFALTPLRSWVLLLLWAVAISILSSISGTSFPKIQSFRWSDKIVHFVAFFPGGFLAMGALLGSFRIPTRWAAVGAIVVISLFGYLDEVHQSFTPKRKGKDTGDWFADTIGGAAGAFVFLSYRRRLARYPS